MLGVTFSDTRPQGLAADARPRRPAHRTLVSALRAKGVPCKNLSSRFHVRIFHLVQTTAKLLDPLDFATRLREPTNCHTNVTLVIFRNSRKLGVESSTYIEHSATLKLYRVQGSMQHRMQRSAILRQCLRAHERSLRVLYTRRTLRHCRIRNLSSTRTAGCAYYLDASGRVAVLEALVQDLD